MRFPLGLLCSVTCTIAALALIHTIVYPGDIPTTRAEAVEKIVSQPRYTTDPIGDYYDPLHSLFVLTDHTTGHHYLIIHVPGHGSGICELDETPLHGAK